VNLGQKQENTYCSESVLDDILYNWKLIAENFHSEDSVLDEN